MSTTKADPRQGFRVGDWEAHPTAGELVGHDGAVQRIEPKVMDVLVELARSWPDVLEREDAIRAVWGARPVADDGLARCIALLRRALGDSRTDPAYIQTVPKRGYRLLATVEFGTPSRRVTASDDATVGESVDAWSGPVEFDNLRIVRLLGRGSMGVVHLAQETNLERLVAVKTLRGALARDERAQRRFKREASAAARIDHPNVTRVYRLGERADGAPYLVMQYVRGRTLMSVMASSGSLDQSSAVSFLRQVSQGLEAAHRERVIHRDVKPGNILIEDETDVATLSDFGIAGIQETGARIATRLTQHGEVLGDVRYISPEQARGDPPTPASDIYSLGIVAYELLTGAYPYREDGNGLLPHLEDDPRSISETGTEVDPSLQRMVMQALSKIPEDRPTATQFLAALAGDSVASADNHVGSVNERGTHGRFTRALVLVAIVIVGLVIAAFLT